MLAKILPTKITDIIHKRLNLERLYEIRLRTARAVSVNYGGTFYYLSNDGLSQKADNAIICDRGVLGEIVVRASDYSLYTVNRNICEGFITVRGGIRIGIAGEYVWNGDEIKTVKNFSGVTVRIPHEIIGCADKLVKPITDGELHNCLIISPPSCGKTTMLRDLCRTLSGLDPRYNILLLDERSEIAAAVDGVPQLDVGNNVDVLSNCDKYHGIIHGIRSMNPYAIVTDELAKPDDIEAVHTAACSGVKIIASVHAADQYDLMNKTGFDKLIKNRLFTRYVVLSNKPSVGSLSGIFDENFERVY